MLTSKRFAKRRKNYGTINILCRPIWIRYGNSRMWDDVDFPQNSHYPFQNRHWISNRTHYQYKRKTEWM